MAREYDNIADAISAVNGEVGEQSTKIANILEALEGKAGGGSGIVETVLVESLSEEMNIYNVLTNVAPYTLHYKTSIVSILIFCDTAAVGGSAYTNNRYLIHHNGISSNGRTFNQHGARVSPTSMLTNYINRGTCYELSVSISNNGKLVIRSASDTISIPVTSKIVVYELPLSAEPFNSQA